MIRALLAISEGESATDRLWQTASQLGGDLVHGVLAHRRRRRLREGGDADRQDERGRRETPEPRAAHGLGARPASDRRSRGTRRR